MRLRNNVFAQYFPELDKLQSIRAKVFNNLAVDRWRCLDPRQIAEMGFEEFVKLITARKITLAQEKRLHWLWEVSSRSAGCRVHDAARWEAQTLLHQLKAIMENVKDLEKRMETTAKTFPEYECLLSIPASGLSFRPWFWPPSGPREGLSTASSYCV